MNKKETCKRCELSSRIYHKIYEIVENEIDEDIFYMDDAIAVLDRVKTNIIQSQVKLQIMAIMDETRDKIQAEQAEEERKTGNGMEFV